MRASKQTTKEALLLAGHGFWCGRGLIACGRVTRQAARQEGNSHLETKVTTCTSYFTQPQAERNKVRTLERHLDSSVSH